VLNCSFNEFIVYTLVNKGPCIGYTALTSIEENLAALRNCQIKVSILEDDVARLAS